MNTEKLNELIRTFEENGHVEWDVTYQGFTDTAMVWQNGNTPVGVFAAGTESLGTWEGMTSLLEAIHYAHQWALDNCKQAYLSEGGVDEEIPYTLIDLPFDAKPITLNVYSDKQKTMAEFVAMVLKGIENDLTKKA